MDFIYLEALLKLGISAILGMIIGLEREMKRKPIGIKTSLVISIVACLLTIVSIESAYRAPENVNGIRIQMDPLRLAAQIVSGIGFLGAGAILRRGNDSITGLTTAAIIWGAAGIGIAVGAGFYSEAIAGVIFIIFSVKLIPAIMMFIGPRPLKEKEMRLDVILDEGKSISPVIEHIKKQKISVDHVRIRDLQEGGHLIQLNIGVNYKMEITYLYDLVTKMDGVRKVEIWDLK